MAKYIYLDRQKAKECVALVFAIQDTKCIDMKQRFKGKAIEFYGEDLPHHITYVPETDTVRQATLSELVSRGVMPLAANQAIVNGELVTFDPTSQFCTSDSIHPKTRVDKIADGSISLESERAKARVQRNREFAALDILDSKIGANRINLTVEEMDDIQLWYEMWLDIPKIYVDVSEAIEDTYPTRPQKIDYFYQSLNIG